MRNRKLIKDILVLTFCILLLLVNKQSKAETELNVFSGVFEYRNENTQVILYRYQWKLDTANKSLDLIHLYNADYLTNSADYADELLHDISKQTGLTEESIIQSIETIRFIGFDFIRAYFSSRLQCLQNIDFGSVSCIENDAFSNIAARELIIPGTVKTVGSFTNCKELRTVCFEEGVEQIAFDAFEECVNLEYVSIPSSVKRIGLHAFRGTPWLERQKDEFVVVGDGILIRYNGTNQTEITIPESIKSVCCTLGFKDWIRVGQDQYYEDEMTNPNVRKVVFGSSVREIHGACYGLEKLEDVVLCDGLQYIGPYAFHMCDNLKTIVVPETVEYLFWNEVFGSWQTDLENYSGPEDRHQSRVYQHGQTPNVVFLGQPPVLHPDESFTSKRNVMWNGDGNTYYWMGIDLAYGIVWHIRYNPKYMSEWDCFRQNAPKEYLIVAGLTFDQQFDPNPYYLKGDANLDCSISSADAALILRHIVGLAQLSGQNYALSDVNGDGRITAGDAAMVLRFLVGLIQTL